MEKLKVLLGFPMLAAGIWLCSLLTIHYGERAWWMALFLVFVATAAWVYGQFVQRDQRHRGIGGMAAIVLLVLGYSIALEYGLHWRAPAQAGAPSVSASEAPQGIAWQNWTPEAVAQARSEGRPVLVDFTAKWCPTCNAIVKPSLENLSVRNEIERINAVPLLANYTLQPGSMTAELNRFGRAGVPLVLVYPRNPSEPPMVFDLVTPGTLLAALSRAAE
jgi:thiol:disulfide interchange protein DsbD